jgi:hypothetical protein
MNFCFSTPDAAGVMQTFPGIMINQLLEKKLDA